MDAKGKPLWTLDFSSLEVWQLVSKPQRPSTGPLEPGSSDPTVQGQKEKLECWVALCRALLHPLRWHELDTDGQPTSQSDKLSRSSQQQDTPKNRQFEKQEPGPLDQKPLSVLPAKENSVLVFCFTKKKPFIHFWTANVPKTYQNNYYLWLFFCRLRHKQAVLGWRFRSPGCVWSRWPRKNQLLARLTASTFWRRYLWRWRLLDTEERARVCGENEQKYTWKSRDRGHHCWDSGWTFGTCFPVAFTCAPTKRKSWRDADLNWTRVHS